MHQFTLFSSNSTIQYTSIHPSDKKIARFSLEKFADVNKPVQSNLYMDYYSGGSRISRRGVRALIGVVDLRCGCFLVKMYAKTKELGPMEEGGRVPRSGNRLLLAII